MRATSHIGSVFFFFFFDRSKRQKRPAYKRIQSKARGQEERGREQKTNQHTIERLHKRILEQSETVEQLTKWEMALTNEDSNMSTENDSAWKTILFHSFQISHKRQIGMALQSLSSFFPRGRRIHPLIRSWSKPGMPKHCQNKQKGTLNDDWFIRRNWSSIWSCFLLCFPVWIL